MGQGMSLGVSGTSSSASIPSQYRPLSATEARWKKISDFAKSCTGKITIGDEHLGCGILIGIDRVLTPRHVVANIDPGRLKIAFSIEDDQHCYFPSFNISMIHAIYSQFVVLQLSPNIHNRHAGTIIPFPEMSSVIHQGEFLFSSFRGNAPETTIKDGSPCREPDSFVQFCSTIPSHNGDCGSGYFDSNGRLFGMHISRSSGMCTLSEEVREAVFLRNIRNSSQIAQKILSAPVCTPLCPPTHFPLPVSNAPSLGPCFIEEGDGRKRELIPISANGITYYAQHDGHGGKHILPLVKKLPSDKKNQLVTGTKRGPAKFFPHLIHTDNYDEFVVNCVQTWIDKGANLSDMIVTAPSSIGADQGHETNAIEIYTSQAGSHIRPKYRGK